MENDIKYERLYTLKKVIKNFTKTRILYVKNSTRLDELLKKIETGKYTVFYVQFSNGKYKFLSEEVVIKLSLNFDLRTRICDIFKLS